jgi:hypothetical protein
MIHKTLVKITGAVRIKPRKHIKPLAVRGKFAGTCYNLNMGEIKAEKTVPGCAASMRRKRRIGVLSAKRGKPPAGGPESK